MANYAETGRNGTMPVDSLPPNPLGLHHMLGNAFDWCLDRFGRYPSGPRTDPRGAGRGDRAVIRGGWRRSEEDQITCSYRVAEKPSQGYPWTGFRVVLETPLKGALAKTVE
jgi:formylglycine-generating enzyme required for sulfatase activity